MKKMMKLFHDSELLGNIEFLGVDGLDMIGRIQLTSDGEKLKDVFSFSRDEERNQHKPPYPDSLLEEGWAIEDHEGKMRKIISIPTILDDFSSIYWRWSEDD